ncbi:MAG: endolytic transglycosylase MltG [Patescibacteria group bacterium]|jgi:UPF0755 protein|nr:endolytic transglycosylase MltG [Patescibacteria group bacterium]
MKYKNNKVTHNTSKTKIIASTLVFIGILLVIGAFGARTWYQAQLRPVAQESRIEVVEIKAGATVQQIANSLAEKKLIRNPQAFMWYVRSNGLVESMKAGSFPIDASLTTPEVISIITTGKEQQALVTILPGQRIDQIKDSLIKNGYKKEQVEAALEPSLYSGHPALVSKPKDSSLEGFLYPESFKVTSGTTPRSIINSSLDEMAKQITPERIDAWSRQDLNVFEAITLASIVEREVSSNSDRGMVAGVFINRLKIGMPLQSDPTYKYAAFLLGIPPSSSIDSPYNTYKIPSLPPGPISNVSKSSLEAVANPTSHDYLYFVSGDDGITRFSKTITEHQEKTAKYCKTLCSSY